MNFKDELKKFLEENQPEGLASLVIVENPSEDPQTTNVSLYLNGQPIKLVEMIANIILEYSALAEILKASIAAYEELKKEGEEVSDGDTV